MNCIKSVPLQSFPYYKINCLTLSNYMSQLRMNLAVSTIKYFFWKPFTFVKHYNITIRIKGDDYYSKETLNINLFERL